MGDPHDLTIDIYEEKKWSKLTAFWKISVFVMASLIILLKFLFVYFPTGLKFVMDRRSVQISLKKSKLCSVWYLYKIKLPKSELNACMETGSQFLDSCSSPPHTLKNVEVVLAPLMLEVMSTQNSKTFKSLQNIHSLSSYRFHVGLK